MKEDQIFTETALNAQRDTFFVFDPSTGEAVRWNKAFMEISGYNDEEISNLKAPESYYREEELERLVKATKIIQQGGTTINELNLITKEGNLIPFEYVASGIFDGEAKLKYIVAIGRDITDRKIAEQKLKESEEKYRALFESANDVIFLLDHYTFIDTNDYMLKIFRYDKKSELIGLSPWDVSPPKQPDGRISKEKAIELIDKCLEGEPQRFYWKHYRKDQIPFDAEVSLNRILVENKYFVQAIVRDITERIIAEQKLKESEEKYRALFESSKDGISLLDIDGNHVDCNKTYAEILGYTRNELSGMNMHVVEFEKWHEKTNSMFLKILEKGYSGEFEIEFKKKNNQIFPVSINAWVRKDINGNNIGVWGIIRDISERKRTEEKLKESEEKFRTIAERSLIGIGIIQDNIIKYINNKMSDILGYSTNEIMSWKPKDYMKTIHPNDRDFIFEQARKKQQGLDYTIENHQFRVITKSNKIKWIENFIRPITYEGKPADLTIYIDITERMKIQQELVKLNQMKSELLRRTSHELKTPLVSIKGFSDLLLELHRDKLENYVISTLDEIKKGCGRLETLISDILKTAELESGTVKLKKSKEDLSFLIRLCVNELKGLSKLRNLTINLNILDEIKAFFEKEQIHQVISNILSNAINYTPSNGVIEIKSELRNDYVVISITDSGVGFTDDEKSQIFKQFGKIERYGQGMDIVPEGSGLGLYISKKIIELHGGEIWLESEGRNKGSSFYFSLPLT